MQNLITQNDALLRFMRLLMGSIFREASDVGQVWGWGYGGEGQLGLGSRIRMVSSPHPVPCIESSYRKDRHSTLSSDGIGYRVPGTYIKSIACGGRHSAAITGEDRIILVISPHMH